MPRKWLIDAYNLLHLIPEIPIRKGPHIIESQEMLAELINRHGIKFNRHAVLVFDGSYSGMKKSYTNVDVVFTAPITADDYIGREMEKSNASNKYIVVSDDREVCRSAAKHRVDYRKAKNFRDELLERNSKESNITKKNNAPSPPPEKSADVEVSDEEVRLMMELFNQDKNEE